MSAEVVGPEAVVLAIDERFVSGNTVPVERATIKTSEWYVVRDELQRLERERSGWASVAATRNLNIVKIAEERDAERLKRQQIELELDAALMQLQGLKEESERLTAEAIRYRWLRSHLAGTIVQRFNPQEMDWRPEKMDALVDSRLHLVPPLDVGGSSG